jgi:hypothetical protein
MTFKTPDGVDYAVASFIDRNPSTRELSGDIYDSISKWVKNGEYLTVEFDIDNYSVTIIPP